jgi:hypothetical protein
MSGIPLHMHPTRHAYRHAARPLEHAALNALLEPTTVEVSRTR